MKLKGPGWKRNVEALDRKKDKEINLADTKVYDEIDKSVEGGEWDGFHSGFPCASFSRVRWRDSPGGPMPVRSAAHIYGLPGNTPSQQKEADEGTLMATRSAWLHKKQVVACQKRGVPEVSTLENPPGAKDSGSAWDLLNYCRGTVQRDKVRHGSSIPAHTKRNFEKGGSNRPDGRGSWRPWAAWQKFAKCPAWVEHVPLMGKQKTEAAGAYPEEPTDAVAKKIVETWKRVLNLEWLRYQFKMKSNLINKLQASNQWLENEERRRKRVYEDSAPENQQALSSEPKKVVREWCVLYILTSTCASRHNGMHFFDISTSKSRIPGVFCTF